MKHIKIPATKFEINPLILNRWSPRAFSQKAISQGKIFSLFEAASWAASAMNEQPWRYVAVLKENEGEFQKLVDCLTPVNAVWAKNAALLLISGVTMHYSSNQKPNASALHDLGLANQNLILQAQSFDIYTQIMGGFDKDKAAGFFDADKNIVPVCMMALGYLGDPSSLDETLQQRENSPRSRRELSEFLQVL
jgi:nitroreductase